MRRWLTAKAMLVALGLGDGAGAQTPCTNFTVDAQCDHPDIIAKADELQTPLRIFEFVHDQIEFEVYYGSKKGAVGTLWSKSGNDFDQASLLIALLRARGISARYVLGVVQVPMAQAKEWASVTETEVARFIFEHTYCFSETTPPHCIPSRFDTTGSFVRLEHAWVEAELPTTYRGIGVGDPAAKTWIPLDASWKTKARTQGIVLPIGNELTGDCAGKICFDYDDYYSKLDPRLPSEIYEAQILDWLHQNQPGTSIGDVPRDGPIVPAGLEVLPLSLPFDPVSTIPLVQTADLGTLSESRRFKIKITVRNADTGSVMLTNTFDFPEVAAKRVTLVFEPTNASRAKVLELGGYLGGAYDSTHDSLFDFCSSNSGNAHCQTTPVLKVDNVPCADCTTSNTRPLGKAITIEIDRDLVPGAPASSLEGAAGTLIYQASAGTYVALGLDGNHAGPAQVDARIDALLTQRDAIGLVHEEEDGNTNDDDNGNGVPGEVLLDQENPGITACLDYAASDAMTTCDVALAANFAKNDLLTGELLHLASLRFFQRLREEGERTLALDRSVAAFLPAAGITKAGLFVDYVFDHAVGVEGLTPVIDVKGYTVSSCRIDDATCGTGAREAKLLAHVASALEHQVWEEITGREFVSTVKGFQVVRERFPAKNILSINSQNLGGKLTELANFPYDTVSLDFRNLISGYIGQPGVTTAIASPIAKASGDAGGAEVMIAQQDDAEGTAFLMLITAQGTTAGGASGFAQNQSQLTAPRNDANRMINNLTADPVSMVSGNNHLEERDLVIPTHGPPFELVRSYNSQSDRMGELGHGWTHSYEMRVEPARVEQELIYLPSSLQNLIGEGSTATTNIEGALSDTLDSWNMGTGSALDVVKWTALPLAFLSRVEIEKVELDIAYKGTFRVEIRRGGVLLETFYPTGTDTDAEAAPGFETFELDMEQVDLGQPLDAELRDLVGDETLYFARLRVRFRGPQIDRVALAPLYSPAQWTGGTQFLENDDDPSTCATPAGTDATIQYGTPAGAADVFAMDVEAAVRLPSSDNDARSEIWLGTNTSGNEQLLAGPNLPTARSARVHFMSTNLNDLTQITYRAVNSSPKIQLCRLKRTLLRLPQEVELLLESGARERFTRTPAGVWDPAPGVRNELEDLPGGGYLVTRPDGSRLVFGHDAGDGAYRLSEIEDAQERGLLFSYDAGTGKLTEVAEEGMPSRYLTLGYTVDHLTSISDWTGRSWAYTVDAARDLVEVEDPWVLQQGTEGIKYEYTSGNVENPELDHNLSRVIYPESRDAVPEGDRWISFTYYNDDKVASHEEAPEDPELTGPTTTFIFNVPRLENQTTDPRGYTTIYRHDEDGNLIQRRDPDGATWEWTYDADRNVKDEKDPFGRVKTSSGFNTRGNPAQILDRDGRAIGLSYDPESGAPDEIVDKRGNTRTTEFTFDGLPERSYATLNGQATPGTLLATNVYDTSSRRLVQRLEPLGDGTGRVRDTRLFYDASNRDLLRVETWQAGALLTKVEYDYDPLGRPILDKVWRAKSPDDPTLIPLVTETSYDRRGRPFRIDRPDGTSEQIKYDENDNVTRRFLEEVLPDGSGVVKHDDTFFSYDQMDRLIKVEDAEGNDAEHRYDAAGNRVETMDPLGHVYRMEYDGLSRPVRAIDPNGAATRNVYDAAGRVITTVDSTNLATHRGYDEVGRLVSIGQGSEDPATRAVFYGPGTAYREEITDPNERTTEYELDDLGRVFEVTDPTGTGITMLSHNLLGGVLSVTDPVNGVTAVATDTLGRPTAITRPYATAAEQIAYDQTGNAIRRTLADGCIVESHFDDMGRLVRQNTGNAVASCAESPLDDQYGYDARGNLVVAKNASVGLIREYDEIGRLEREIDSRFASQVGYAWDRGSRLTSKVYPDGATVHYSYDAAGRTVGISDPFGDTTRFLYDPAGRRIQKRGTSSLRTDTAYDDLGRLTAVTSYRSNGTVAASHLYPTDQHDDVGNRLRMNEGVGKDTDYTYDELDRLASVDPYDAPLTHFGYDAAGNRMDMGPKSGSTWISPHTSYAYDARKRLTGISVDAQPAESFSAYDANGNPTSWTPPVGGARTLHYDALGQLVRISGGFSATYVYDPFGRRIRKTEAGLTTHYQYDGLDVVAEYATASPSAQPEATYVFGPGIDEVIKIERGATVAAYHTDGLGSIVAISSGATDLKTYRYDAFGVVIVESTAPFANAYTYTGRERDASGLYYYRARYYHAESGRFLTPDPIGLAGGINAYTYVGSNPVNYTDPFGLRPGRALAPAAPPPPPAFGTALRGIGAGIGLAAASIFVPYAGETLDAYTVTDRNAAGWERGLAAVSLTAGVVTGGLAPNASGVIQGGRRVTSAVGDLVVAARGGAVPERLFHHTTADAAGAIAKEGLIPGQSGRVFLTPEGGLSPLQAHIDLALPPNRAANALFEVDVGAMRRLGIDIPAPTPVGRSYNMPGGGLEVPIDRAIPPELLRRVR